MVSPEGGHSPRSVGEGVALAGLLPATLHLVLTLGYDSSYSHQLYAREAFVGQYRHGVYQYRVLGRELVLAVGRVLHHFNVVLHTTATDIGHGRPPADLFTAFVVVNGVALVALASVLYLATVARPGAGDWRLSYVVLIVLVALSGYVVTPYDYLGYFFTVAAVVTALQPRSFAPPLCLVLACAGTATRESFVVAVAAVAAVLLGRHGWRALARWRDPLWWSGVALAAGWLGTYVTLRVVVGDEPGTSLWMRMPRELNWQMSTPVALVFLALGMATLQLTWPALAGHARVGWRWTRLWFWILSAPYLAACVIGGIWFEALRLVLPVVLCEHVLRRAVAGGSAAELPLRDGRVAVHPKVLEPQREA